ncbi:hypothetical protein NCAS_0F03190 [Naumovozyma castellii]|uniref:Uncharacterized protein n=1 Tax=Naumovozyma castellii TaxID=27288 RepID=G0VH31_NAUCA|nr:hypothetical protein NCAS_0F03190 [Naumovozyma castellii CBS 4309]CCC70803.1 hypothetical protein NCAS_0F03190 [Naumovozyma castellii CBS 4309]
MIGARSIWSIVSNVNGSIAFVSSFISLLPQILETYHDKTVVGLSPWFLLAWLCGDITSLTGAILTNQLMFQIVLAIYFLLNDMFVCGQYYYYGILYENKLATTGHEPKPVLESISGVLDVTPDMDESTTPNSLEAVRSRNSSQTRAALISAMALANSIQGASAMPIPLPGGGSGDGNRYLTNTQIGTVLSWAGACFYVGARIPQLYKNYKRKSTDGISPFLFATTLLGNVTYNVSIFTSCNFLNSDDKIAFVINELPFIFGSAGTIAFDLIYFYQYYVLYADDMKWRELEREILEDESDGETEDEQTALLG